MLREAREKGWDIHKGKLTRLRASLRLIRLRTDLSVETLQLEWLSLKSQETIDAVEIWRNRNAFTLLVGV